MTRRGDGATGPGVVSRLRWSARRAVGAIVALRPTRCLGDIEVEPEIGSDTAVIRGWTASRDVQSVLVVVGGDTLVARFGIERPDLARARHRNPIPLRSGWEAVVDVRGREGEHLVVEAFAVTGPGLVDRLAARTVHVVPSPVFRFDDPLDGGRVWTGFTAVRGTACAAEPVSRVDVTINGEKVGPARLYTAPTPDLAVRWLPGSPLASFAAMLDLRAFAPGTTIQIGATATLASGATQAIAPVTATVEAPVWPSATDASAARLAEMDTRVEPDGVAPPPQPTMLVVTHDLGIGGAQLYINELLGELRERTSWRFVVVAPRDAVLRAALEDMGCEVHVVGEFPHDDPLAYEARVLELRQLARATGASMVLVNTSVAGIGADVGRRLGLPVVWAIHESFALEEIFVELHPPFGAHPMITAALRDALAGSTAVVFEATATRCLYENDGDAPRFVTVFFGVPTHEIGEYAAASDRTALRHRHGVDDDELVVLCVGTFEPRKAQAMLATAFASIAAGHPSAVLVMVGDRDHPYCDALHDLVERLGLGAADPAGAGDPRLLAVVRDGGPLRAPVGPRVHAAVGDGGHGVRAPRGRGGRLRVSGAHRRRGSRVAVPAARRERAARHPRPRARAPGRRARRRRTPGS